MADSNLNVPVIIQATRLDTSVLPRNIFSQSYLLYVIAQGTDVGNVANKANEAGQGAYDAQVRNDEQDVILVDHEERIRQLRIEVDDHEIRIAANTAAIAALDVRLTTAEGEIVTLQADVSALDVRVPESREIAMLYAFKLGRKLRGEEPYCPEKGGKGGSSDKSAKYAAEAQKYAADLQNQQWQTIMKNLAPFTPLAEQYVNQLQNLSSLEGQGQALNQYYNSQQYKDLAGQARYQSLAAAEATGGLGSTATSNQLATIAPTLGQSWLSNQMSNYNNLANVGLGALQGQANAGQTYANNMSSIAQQSAALAAANANKPSSLQTAISGGTSGAIAGAGLASLLGTSTPWGAGIGAGIGLLGSLF